MKSFRAERQDGTAIGLPHGNFQTALDEAEAWHRKNGKHAIVVATQVVWTTQGLSDAMIEGGVEL
jgi:hypothetical protein